MYNFTIKSFRKLLPFIFEYNEYATFIYNKDDVRSDVANYFFIVKNCMQELTEEEAHLIKLRFLLGYSRAEIAEEESISLDAASKKLSRVETKFYELFLNQLVE